jgi:hypothetical protein
LSSILVKESPKIKAKRKLKDKELEEIIESIDVRMKGASLHTILRPRFINTYNSNTTEAH